MTPPPPPLHHKISRVAPPPLYPKIIEMTPPPPRKKRVFGWRFRAVTVTLTMFSFLFQMLGLSYFYGGFLVGPQVISCHVIMQIGNLIVKGLYLDCKLSLFFFMVRITRARETRDARREKRGASPISRLQSSTWLFACLVHLMLDGLRKKSDCSWSSLAVSNLNCT